MWPSFCSVMQYNDLTGYFMKFTTALLFTISLVVSSNTNATLLTDLGGVDEFIASETLDDSGDGTELSWVRNMLGDQTLTLDEKYNSSETDWSLVTNETDVYSTLLSSSPGYFLLKFGVGQTGVDSHFIFKNVGDLSYGVIDFSLAGIVPIKGKKFTIGKISHVDEFEASIPNNTSIPEPMTISLFAIALLGFARRSHRR